MEAVKDRALLMEWLRSEIVGPRQYLLEPRVVGVQDSDVLEWKGPVAWREGDQLQEVIYFNNETPLIKYGSGILHPRRESEESEQATADVVNQTEELESATSDDTIDNEYVDVDALDNGVGDLDVEDSNHDVYEDEDDDHETAVQEFKRQSAMGLSVCIADNKNAAFVVSLPARRRYHWQEAASSPFEVNGYYRRRVVKTRSAQGKTRNIDVWYRASATSDESKVVFFVSEFVHNGKLTKQIPTAISNLKLEVSVITRKSPTGNGWIVTAVLTNESESKENEQVTSQLFQSYFEVHVEQGSFQPYPEASRTFESLDADEQSLELLYRNSPQWGVGHSCSAAWDSQEGDTPEIMYAEVMPATELPSMTPDVVVNGKPLTISMLDMVELSDDGSSTGWQALKQLISGYQEWIKTRRGEISSLDKRYASVAMRHIAACEDCLIRMQRGLEHLRADELVRDAFRNANKAMLLQQIASKQLGRRQLETSGKLRPHFTAPFVSPLNLLTSGNVASNIGTWRAFQIAFFLLSLPGVTEAQSDDREIVDLIWFPTGGGKTEAYLAVAACYLWHQRLLGRDEITNLRRDGTGVIMRYTLRMLTTQQFQRAASLICSMEVLRKDKAASHGLASVDASPFSLGLWIGQAGSPNTCEQAKTELNLYKREYGKQKGGKSLNPLVLLECPWCRAEIGVVHDKSILGIGSDINGDPKLMCSDTACEFGGQYAELPIEVIDERIYKRPPSFIIATVDKFAMAAYRPGDDKSPAVSSLFGREFHQGKAVQRRVPPGLIIQDELHLISGPIGTMYALYESAIEDLCTWNDDGLEIKPKIIASTATIRGAEHQVKALYNRNRTFLFPCPGLQMGDSFFGRYAVDHETGKLARGRMYLGLSTPDYRSSIKLQVESLTAPLYRTWLMKQEDRDPWWTLLVFYNSLREIGLGQTLFNGQVRGRLNYVRRRDGLERENTRYLNDVRELSSRLSQSGLIDAMDTLAKPYKPDERRPGVDVCLTSNIIEVGVDIDRLSLMAVVGQPRSTASYIQITGRVGRKWFERPGLILMLYNHNKRRDISHYEHFQSFHHRMYEQVEPTSATPYSHSALRRGLMGVLLLRLRMRMSRPVHEAEHYLNELDALRNELLARALDAQSGSSNAIQTYFASITEEMKEKWRRMPQTWEKYPPTPDERYLMLWPGEEYSPEQHHIGIPVPTSMRHVDTSSRLKTRPGYH